jgi:hypothetical protein
MLAAAFARWWYGAGWKLVQKSVQVRMQRTLDSFSVPTLAKTLFAPWKRVMTAPGAGIEAYFRAMVDNAVSRMVGFTIRLIVLLTAGVCFVGIGVAGVLQIILWPLVPVLVVICLVLGAVGAKL